MILKVIGDGSPTGTKVIDESGADVSKSIRSVRFEHRAGGAPSVEVDIMLPEVGFQGEGKFYFRDRQIARIVYADGGEELF